jgi:4-hydroxyphenylpyruvate dioxygenase
MSAPVFAVKSNPPSRDAVNPLGLLRLDHLQICGALAELELLYRGLGFSRVATASGNWGSLRHMRQNRMDVVLGETDDSTPFGRYALAHGSGVNALAFEVEDVEKAFHEALKRGAEPLAEPVRTETAEGAVVSGAIQGFGDVWNLLVAREGRAPFRPDLEPDPLPALSQPGLLRVDHLTNNVGVGELDRWVEFYERIFGFAVVREFHIRGALGTGLTSKVVQSSNGRVIIPINEPTDEKSQVQEFIERHRGPGVQHIAMATANIAKTLPLLKAQGIAFLGNPDTYYEMLPGRISTGGYDVSEDLERVREMGLLVDGDETGYLLQIFSEDQIGPLFYEVIQRKGNQGFGEGNFKALYDSIELDQRRRGVL